MNRIFQVIALCAIAMLTSCATTPLQRFSETIEQVQSDPNIDIVIDSFVVSDIRGKSLGYNTEKNSQRATAIKDTVVSVLESKGYKPNVVFIGSGFQQDIFDEQEVFYSSDWKSTGEEFSSAVVLEGDAGWKERTATDYFDAVLEEALGANWTPPKYDLLLPSERTARDLRLGLTPEQQVARKAIFEKPPKVISTNASDKILFIKYSNIDVSDGKKFAIGLLSGTASLAASGGTSATVMQLIELGPMELAVMNKSTQEILWALSSENTSVSRSEKAKVTRMLHYFPKRN